MFTERGLITVITLNSAGNPQRAAHDTYYLAGVQNDRNINSGGNRMYRVEVRICNASLIADT